MNIVPRSAFLLSLFGEPPPPPVARDATTYPIMLCGRPNWGLIDTQIRQQLPLVRHCYTQARSRDASAQGTLVLELTARASEVVGVRLQEDTVGDPLLADCVLDAFRWLRFPINPARTSELVVHYPIRLVPAESRRDGER